MRVVLLSPYFDALLHRISRPCTRKCRVTCCEAKQLAKVWFMSLLNKFVTANSSRLLFSESSGQPAKSWMRCMFLKSLIIGREVKENAYRYLCRIFNVLCCHDAVMIEVCTWDMLVWVLNHTAAAFYLAHSFNFMTGRCLSLVMFSMLRCILYRSIINT